MARPKKEINESDIEKLAAINCSYAEIGAVVGCDSSTLTRRFAQVIEKGREQGKMSLKRKMWETAMNGNVTMMIWLSKQMLGYTEKVEQRSDLKAEAHLFVPSMTKEQAQKLLDDRNKGKQNEKETDQGKKEDSQSNA